jgi:predicted aminopeptidase
VKNIIGLLAVAALVACGSDKPQMSNQILHEGAPNWVNKGSGAFNGEKGKVFYGIGISSGIRNAALRRQDADSKARADIAAILNTYVTRLTKSYAASTMANDPTQTSEEQHVSDALKTYTQMQLSGVAIVDHWIANDGSEYSLAQLDMEGFKGQMDKMKELNAKVRDQVKANADKAFDELSAEEAKH